MYISACKGVYHLKCSSKLDEESAADENRAPKKMDVKDFVPSDRRKPAKHVPCQVSWVSNNNMASVKRKGTFGHYTYCRPRSAPTRYPIQIYTIKLSPQQEIYVPLMWRVSKSAGLTRRGVGDAAAGLGLHFLHMSESPFSHDTGLITWLDLNWSWF